MRADIILYDDIAILTETEIECADTKQLRDYTKVMLRDEPLAVIAEAYNAASGLFVFSYKKLSNGQIREHKRREHPNWGGARPGAGRKALPEDVVKDNLIVFKADLPMTDALEHLGRSKGEYIREAIMEKMEREGKPLPKPKIIKEPNLDNRYAAMLRRLPATLRCYHGTTRELLSLTMTKNKEGGWTVGYGRPSDNFETIKGTSAPMGTSDSPLEVLLWLQDWLDEHRGKYIITE